jgi:PilZ domain.
MKEQRKYIRRFAAMNVDCYSADGAKAMDTCLLVNISRGGVAIETKKTFPLKEKFMLRFISPDGRQYYILTELLHSSKGGFGNLYGAKYCETNLKTLSDFNAYLLKYFNLY